MEVVLFTCGKMHRRLQVLGIGYSVLLNQLHKLSNRINFSSTGNGDVILITSLWFISEGSSQTRHVQQLVLTFRKDDKISQQGQQRIN